MAQPDDPADRIDAGDDALARPFGHPVTKNEAHAAVLGLSGTFAGAAYATGHTYEAVTLTSALVGYALLGRPVLRSLPHDAPAYGRSMAIRTIRHEPWWFLASYVLWAVVAAGVTA